GVLLTYERQMIDWADTRAYRNAPPSADATRLPVETLLAGINRSNPGLNATTITIRADRSAPAAIGLAGGRTFFVNPYTGEALGEGSKRVRDFFQSLREWHRWLGARGDNRAVARAITGACNLGFLFLVLSGIYLWWPRKFAWSQVKNVVWFKRGLQGRTRDFNWHNVIGFWSAIPLFIVVLSAVVISYTWASNLVYRVVGEDPPAPRAASAPASGETAPAASASIEGLNLLWGRAEQQVTGWQSISLRVPNPSEPSATFTIDSGNGGQPQKRAQLTLDKTSGEVVKWEPFSSYTAGRQLRSLLRFAHTGEVAGVAGQTVAGIVSAGGAVLVWTGLALGLRRFRAWRLRSRPSRSRAAVPRLAEESSE
ncbi:MAG TPA: PepSY-associated TM helix domain-containing protein, partial [Blastocatellia bacterium]|nr:PepSY-associated TM helix domain-containing protein [Blastocatellia bacterium]